MKEKLAEMEAEAKKLKEVQAQVEKDLSTQSMFCVSSFSRVRHAFPFVSSKTIYYNYVVYNYFK
jgi:hypothetical protein